MQGPGVGLGFHGGIAAQGRAREGPRVTVAAVPAEAWETEWKEIQQEGSEHPTLLGGGPGARVAQSAWAVTAPVHQLGPTAA